MPNETAAGAEIPLSELVERVRACRACEMHLPNDPRPVIQVNQAGQLLVASQAPGIKVQSSGVPFSDASGDRLRNWIGLSPAEFYDEQKVAILPMAFCYPGRRPGGDAPPPKECAALWRTTILDKLPNLRLTLLVGTYAQNYALGPGNMTERVRHFRDYLPGYFPLPHPSWRVQIWAKHNLWFEESVLPELKKQVARALTEIAVA